ncbi:MAG TPA: hypothetical protein DD670_10680 [Planctomycetaceae bacterium]|nr:hypothetical protein [Planctomycetaceae bacterium]
MRLDPGTPKKVVIRTAAHVAIIPATVAELVAPLLTTHVPRLRDDNGTRAVGTEICAYFERDRDGSIWTSAGIVPRIRKHLENSGYVIEVDDRTIWTQYDNMDDDLSRNIASLEEESLFAALASHPRGQIVVNNQRQLAKTIARVAFSFPTLNILVVARNLNERDRLHRAISELVDGNVCRCDHVNWRAARLLLATPFSFGVCVQRDWHIVMFTDATVALGEWQQVACARMSESLLYGCVGPSHAVGPRGCLELESILGPTIFEWPGPRGRLASVKVSLVSTTHGITNSGLDLATKRQHIWRNAPRNDSITNIADAVVRADNQSLEQQGVPVDPEWFDGEKRPTISILVESTEHAGELSKRLPGWRIKHDVPRDDFDADESTDFSVALGDLTITTVTRAHRCGIDTDIILRADGGVEWPIGAERFPRCARYEGDAVSIIDFIGHEETAERLRRREAVYSAQGWSVSVGKPSAGCQQSAPSKEGTLRKTAHKKRAKFKRTRKTKNAVASDGCRK